MKLWKRGAALALALTLLAGSLYIRAGAEASGGTSGFTTWELSMGKVTESAGQVHLTLDSGTVLTFSSASLPGVITFNVNEMPDQPPTAMTFQVIFLEPGCISYTTNLSGQIYTDREAYDNGEAEWGDMAWLLCRHFIADTDSTLAEEGYSDRTLVGSAYQMFRWEQPYFLTTFVGDGGVYCVTTQEALDHLTALTGAEVKDPSTQPAVGPFTDIPAGAYYTQALEWALEKGITSGTGANTFSPDSTVTRAEAVTILWRAAGSPAPASMTSPFTDVTDPNAYYYKAVLWAAEQGITGGVGNGAFGLTQTLSQSQSLALLCRWSGGEAEGGDWETQAIQWGAGHGLIDSSDLNGSADCPRARVFFYLWKYQLLNS